MSEDLFFAKIFSKRGVICFFVMVCFFVTCILRIAVLAEGSYAEKQEIQSSSYIRVKRLRSSIFDRNGIPLTNNKIKTYAAVLPTEEGYETVNALLSGEKKKTAIEKLNKGECAVFECKTKIYNNSVCYTEVFDGNCGMAEHIIGYLDDTAHGISGIEGAYDDLLYSDKYVSAVCSTMGNGEILCGISPHFENDLSVVNDGVVTTVDINIQNIVESVSGEIVKGAVIVADAKNGKIRAIKSLPSYDVNNISASLNDENSPLINRCLMNYNVGSVFKPCVASAAMECGKTSFIYNCKGYSYIIDRNFRCHKSDGHGETDLRSALAFSCNTFFYNFGIYLGKEVIYNMASSLNFGAKLKLGENIYTKKGNLTSLQSLSNDAMLANFCIGQGDLLLSPVNMLTLYCAIASDGCYYVPSLIECTVKNGIKSPYDYGKKTRVMSEKSAKLLREYLGDVLSVGTGTNAMPKTVSAAGKTATAQTGRYYDNGSEINNSWFCGMFPKENPQYVVIVMAEGQKNAVCNTVFSEIADRVSEIKK